MRFYEFKVKNFDGQLQDEPILINLDRIFSVEKEDEKHCVIYYSNDLYYTVEENYDVINTLLRKFK